jgi:hypothetical protein
MAMEQHDDLRVGEKRSLFKSKHKRSRHWQYWHNMHKDIISGEKAWYWYLVVNILDGLVMHAVHIEDPQE